MSPGGVLVPGVRVPGCLGAWVPGCLGAWVPGWPKSKSSAVSWETWESWEGKFVNSAFLGFLGAVGRAIDQKHQGRKKRPGRAPKKQRKHKFLNNPKPNQFRSRNQSDTHSRINVPLAHHGPPHTQRFPEMSKQRKPEISGGYRRFPEVTGEFWRFPEFSR